MYDNHPIGNPNGSLTDEPIDLYGCDMAWRVVAVVQYDPPSQSFPNGQVRIRERYFYHAAGDGSAADGTGSVGPAGRDTPIMTADSAAGQAG